MEKPELITKAEKLVEKINLYLKNRYSMIDGVSIDELILDTEILIYSHDKNFPALFDIKKMKEQYSDRYYDFTEVITEKLIKILNKFADYLK